MIGENLRFELSDGSWSEHQLAVFSLGLGIRRHGTTSSVAAPVLAAEAELAVLIALAGSEFQNHHSLTV